MKKLYKIESKVNRSGITSAWVLVAKNKEEAIDLYIEFMGDLYTHKEVEENFYIYEHDMDEIVEVLHYE
jgi:hypothetical protein